ncbi:flavodoxin family protein [Methanobrevibacter sp.]|uniref:flavodoxin family protein n=1 Tax=Methanobrevibacter sp. TaxID=66852 RepID=UPI0038910B7D
MKYLIINGSPRLGNTYGVINQVKNSLDGEFEEVFLIGERIPMCRGCFKCIEEGEKECPDYDKVNPIVEKMKSCDAIIIGSPVYAMNVTALLKNFFDHTAYLFHRPELFTKKALVVVTTAGAGHKKVAKYIDETLRHWGVNRTHKIAIAVGGKDLSEFREIDKVALKFASDNKLRSPKLSDIVFFNVWKVMATSSNPIEADKEFWYSTGLVNHDFSPDVKLGFFKTVFSKFIGFVMHRVLK